MQQSTRKVFVRDPEESKGSESESKSSVTFILPFATPGSGKSYLWKHIKNSLPKDYTFASVSSDDIRSVQMQELMSKGKTKEQAFDMTQKSSQQQFSYQL